MSFKAWRERVAAGLCLAVIFSNIFVATAQQPRRSASPAGARKAKLVVGIVIDQFRYEYLPRFADQFGEGGFKRLTQSGAVFSNANYIHVPTYTACGHATFMTGSVPSVNGIVGNEWYDRETGKRVTSVNDGAVKLLGGRTGTGMSPAKLLGSTIGDELKLASNQQAKVVGVSLKDRSAILPAGKRPNGAYWYDGTTGNLVSSTWYFEDLPAWVKKFNQEMGPARFFGKRWEKLLPEAAYARSTADEMAYEKSAYGNKFPYTITGGEEKPGAKFFSQFEYTPFANDYLIDFAKAAIENEGLGADDVTDLLTVSLSSNDLVGHLYGPYSHEVHDITLRTDRTLAGFFAYLDQKIGAGNYLVALTADHGVAPVPEQVRTLGYGGKIEAKAIGDAVQAALARAFGEEKWVLQTVNGNVYLDEAAIARRKLDAEAVERVAAQAAVAVGGVAECFTRSQILAGRLPQTHIARAVAHGFHSKRNGNLVIITEPFYFIGEGITTTHGSPYVYDTHVPVILYGPGVAPGEYRTVASPADIAPTLASLLRIETPSNSVGRVLIEAVR